MPSCSLPASRDELANAVQYTEPMETHRLAQVAQKARLCLVTFQAHQYKSSIPTPTMDQLRKMYDRLKDTLPVSLDATPNNPFQTSPQTSSDDPLGFGYQLPRRVSRNTSRFPARLCSMRWPGPSRITMGILRRGNIITPTPTNTPPPCPAPIPRLGRPRSRMPRCGTTCARQAPQPRCRWAPGRQIRTAIFDKLHADWDRYAVTTQPATQSAFGPTTAPAATPLAKVSYFQQLALDIKRQFGGDADRQRSDGLGIRPGRRLGGEPGQ